MANGRNIHHLYYMPNRVVADQDALKHRLYTRVNDRKYTELQKLLEGNPRNDMSQLLRDILHNRPVKVFTKDKTLDNVMEELARLRTEIRYIGVNINQITRLFNTYPEPHRKAEYAKIAFEEYQSIGCRIDELLIIVSKLGRRWLSE
jgi:hypothetical protein